MNRIPEWNREHPKCLLCGETDLRMIRLEFQEEANTGIVCEQCKAVYVDKNEEVFFMGFLPQAEWFKVLITDNPMIKVGVSPVIDPLMN